MRFSEVTAVFPAAQGLRYCETRVPLPEPVLFFFEESVSGSEGFTSGSVVKNLPEPGAVGFLY